MGWIEHGDASYIEMKNRDIAGLRAKVAALEAERSRYASIEGKDHLQTIDERDAAEDAISQAYFLIIGKSPEWSNLFGHEQAIEEIDDAQRCLRAEIKALDAENGKLKTALDIISNHGVQYPWAECARIAQAALAQQPKPAQDKEQG